MEKNPNFVSPCGLYCGVCAVYMAHRDKNEKFKKLLVNVYQGKIEGKGTLPGSKTLSSEDIHCSGCLSDDRFLHCQQCDIQECVKKKEIVGCWECREFPCPRIENFPMAVGKKVILRSIPYIKEVGVEKWAQDEQARYVCPDCGNRLFRGVGKCNQCHTELDLD